MRAARLGAMVVFAGLALAAPVQAERDLNDLFGIAVKRYSQGALAVMGFAAVPSETASALILDTGANPGRQADFVAAQLGGGFRWSDDLPVYLEGYIGYNRYDPVLVLEGQGQTSRLPLKWTSVAATGGIGYEFDLSPYLVLRPLAHIVLGRVQTDTSVAAKKIGDFIDVDVNSLKDGGFTAGGGGASLALYYDRRFENDYEVDMSLRYTYLHFEPIGGDKDLGTASDASTLTLWSRQRFPTGKRLFNRPVRVVTEASMSYMPGDQGEVLNTDWLAQIGLGGEIDLVQTWVPWVTTTRLVARYTKGEYLEGYSLGLAASF
ncbi:hypothetical protein [Pseudoruegeria sp. SK021]|uniref:hypothetical protein n=1 Tax=Pseudoruegeria sp. SK021 TaxID=1933035 RepID=UPI000A230DF3|nr:hypothetical protein [Pseudoruegeria sp. SK021]OSP55739.1 hypothetical protein BV911_06445 [Pseudoruegeria sp. SK021]